MFERIFKKFFKKNGKEGPRVLKRRDGSVRKKIEKHTSAVVLAEAGLHEEAKETVKESASEQGKVLVATYGHRFSRMVIDYTVGFAERMGMEIIAINVEPIDIEYTKALGGYTNVLSEKFKEKAEEEILDFKTLAEKKGTRFRHVVKFGDLNECIKEVCESENQVEFVITDPTVTEDSDGKTIPVFCLTPET